jgi:hypothetical protein
MASSWTAGSLDAMPLGGTVGDILAIDLRF